LEISTATSSGTTLPKREKHRRTAESSEAVSGDDSTDSEQFKNQLKEELRDENITIPAGG
jgi:hypothetical protein